MAAAAGVKGSSLIERLNLAQEQHGFLDPAELGRLAAVLELPPSRVQGTASFYHLFRFQPPAAHQCIVCTGTACHVKGAQSLIAALESDLHTRLGGTSSDGTVDLRTVRCLGTCGGAPLVQLDGVALTHQTPSSLRQVLKLNGLAP